MRPGTQAAQEACALHLVAGRNQLYIWAEGAPGDARGRRDDFGMHRFCLGPDLLAQAAAVETAAIPVMLMLLHGPKGPWPSPRAVVLGIAPDPPVQSTPTLRRTIVWAVRIPWSLYVQELQQPTKGWPERDEWAAARDIVRLAQAHWRLGAVAPALRSVTNGLWAAYVSAGSRPALEGELQRIAQHLPQAFLAQLNVDGGRLRPRSEAVREMVDLAVDAIVPQQHVLPQAARQVTYESLPKARQGVLALLTPPCARRLIVANPPALKVQAELAAWAATSQASERTYNLLLRLEVATGPPRLCAELQLQRPLAGEAPLLDWSRSVAQRLLPAEAFDEVLALGGAAGQHLRSERPTAAVSLTADELFDFLESGAKALRSAGVAVFLPRELVRRPQHVGLRLQVKGRRAGMGLQALYDVDWQVLLAGAQLRRDELMRLARAQSPLVELHGSYVLVSPQELRIAAGLVRKASEGGVPLGEIVDAALGAEPGQGIEVDLAVAGELGATFAPAFERAPAWPQPAPPAGLLCSLRPYQREGFAFLDLLVHQGFGALLADDMGLGKTVQVLALLLRCKLEGHGASLVVAPTSVLAGWREQAARFAPDLQVHLYHGSGRRLPEAGDQDVVLTTYGVLARDQELAARSWHVVVFDEAQVLKNPGSLTRAAAARLDAQAKVALSGTPVENGLLDLWSIVDLALPGYLGGARRFQRQVAAPVAAGNIVAAAALRRRIAPFFKRRRKEDRGVADELPRLVLSREAVYLTSEQAALYRATLDDLARRLRESEGDGLRRRGMVVAALTRLKLLADHPALLLRQGGPLAVERSRKVERLFAILDEACREGDRILVYSQFAQFVTRLRPLLEERLALPVSLLTGSMGRGERDVEVERFKAASGPAAFLLSLRAGGLGLNLQTAQRVVHLDRWWNPAVEDQATGRAHRIGQTRTVFVHTMLARGTIEERIDEILEEKRALSETIVGGEAGYLAALQDEELLKTLELREELP